MKALQLAARRRLARIDGGGVVSPQAAFSGALHNRLNADWVLAGIQSADQEVRRSLRTLKARSRELARNNGHATRYLEQKKDNVIGADGILLQAQVHTPGGSLWTDVNRAIEDAWQEWCEVGVCTACGKHSFVDVERLTVEEEARDGDGIVRLLPAWRGNRFGFALQLIDPDQLDLEFHRDAGVTARGERSNEIRMGVEIDEWGRSIAYHLWGSHPTEAGGREDRRIAVPADQIMHWFRPYRVGQTRGIPDFTPILMTLKMIAGYEEAEVVSARLGASKGGFFERTAEAVQVLGEAGEASDTVTMEAEPGLFDSLPPGWKFSAWDPTHPTSAFADFHKAMLRTVAAGLGISYHRLAQNLEGVSFSSIRSGELAERDTYRSLQGSLWRHFHNRVYREWVKWALTSGAIALPRSAPLNPRIYHDVVWQPRGWDWVDPLRDAQSSALEIRLGVNSRTRIAAAKGRNFEDIVEEIAHENELARAAGVELTTDMGRGRVSGAEEGDDPLDQDDPPLSSERLQALLTNGARARTGRRLTTILNGNGGHHAPHDR